MHHRKKFTLLLSIVMIAGVVLFCACGRLGIAQSTYSDEAVNSESEEQAVLEEPLPTPSPLATPTPEPTPSATPSPQRLPRESELRSMLRSALSDGHFVMFYYDIDDEDSHTFSAIAAQPGITEGLLTNYKSWLAEGLAVFGRELGELYENIEFTSQANVPDWQLLASVAYMYRNTPTLMQEACLELIDISVDLATVSGKTKLHVTLTPVADPAVFYELPAATEDGNMGALFLCCYMRTLYDEQYQALSESAVPDELPPPLQAFPLPKAYSFSDGWLIDRDDGARMHTGTDILCPEGTFQLACADSTVLDAGFNEGAGNYVVLRGEDGTQYHYYHMVTLSEYVQTGDRVLADDIIGLTGNTGNSAADHLHFTIISPEGYYINPYPYLMDAMEEAFSE